VSGLLSLFHFASNYCGVKSGVFPGLYDGLPCPNGTPQLTSLQDTLLIVANVVRILIMAAGSLAVIALIVAGIYYVASGGDAGRVKRAKDIIINTTVGLVLIIASYEIVTFIAGGF
jgi:hypothetical protein